MNWLIILGVMLPPDTTALLAQQSPAFAPAAIEWRQHPMESLPELSQPTSPDPPEDSLANGMVFGGTFGIVFGGGIAAGSGAGDARAIMSGAVFGAAMGATIGALIDSVN